MPIFSKERRKGNLGETLACMFLMKQGYIIIDRNYLKPWGEIDIVAKKGNTLYFIEIKSVSHVTVSRETIRPEENMHTDKGKRLTRVIQTYMTHKHISRETLFQVDLLTVRISKETREARIERFEKIL